MKKVLVALVAMFTIGLSNVMAQTAEEWSAAQKRIEKLQKLCKKQPASTGLADVDSYVAGVYTAAVQAPNLTQQLDSLYKRQMGQTEKGVTDVTVKKPSLEELKDLGVQLTSYAASLVEAAKGAEAAIKQSKEVKGLNAVKVVKAVKFTKDAYPVLLEESAFQVKAIEEMIKTAKSAGNL